MVTHRDREVHIEVTARHQHVSDKTRTFAIERAEKLTRFNDRVDRIQVVFDEGHDAFSAEIIVHVGHGGTMVCKEDSDGYRSALDAALVKMERQLKKDKEKRSNHKHEPAELHEDVDMGEEETYEDVVRESLR